MSSSFIFNFVPRSEEVFPAGLDFRKPEVRSKLTVSEELGLNTCFKYAVGLLPSLNPVDRVRPLTKER